MSTPRTISIVGGGPGGLFLGILLRQKRPDWAVEIWERNAPDATFGFGVVFSDRTVERLEQADPESLSLIRESFQSWTDIEISTPNGFTRTGGHGFSAIARHRLLNILQQRARDVSLPVHYESEVANLDELYSKSDVVVGADGINSQVREHWRSQFDTEIRQGAARFIWFATPRRYDALTFHFVDTEYGPFSTHAYPFSDELSTFIVETDTDTWQRAGLDRSSEGNLGIGESDKRSMDFCREIFTESLHGQELVGNASQWRQFPTVRNHSWIASDKVVILGDAAHTAHFSVGSGTKMAMEDAYALAEALTETDDPSRALHSFETSRKPLVSRIQELAEPSRGWWENFHAWVDRDINTFSVNFLSRTGRETIEHLQTRDAAFASEVIDSDFLDRELSISSDITLSSRRALLLDASDKQLPHVINALQQVLPSRSLVIVQHGDTETLKLIKTSLRQQNPVIAHMSEQTGEHFENIPDLRLTTTVDGEAPDSWAFVIRTPGSIDDADGWKEILELARQAQGKGARLLFIEAAESTTDRRALLTHAGVVLRPDISIPMILAPCGSDAEGLLHLNAGRADAIAGHIGPHYFRKAHDALALQALLEPRGIVVVGASQDPSKPGHVLLRNLDAFKGTVIGLSRHAGNVHGRTIVADAQEIPDDVDLAILAVPSSVVPSSLELLARRGVRSAIICSGGFAELQTSEGRDLQGQVDAIAAKYGIRVLGPNTAGMAIPHLNLHASFVPAVTQLTPGAVAVVAQSAGVAHAAALALEQEGLGVGLMIGVGNACDIDLPELIQTTALSGQYDAIAVYLEGTAHGSELLEAIRKSSRAVPVVVLKSGISDVDRLTVSHTGAMAGDWAVAQSLLTEAGAVVVSTLGDLINSIAALSLIRLHQSGALTTKGVGVVTGQAGPGVLLTDRLQTLGLEVPPFESTIESELRSLLPPMTHRQNPVDTGRPSGTFANVIATVAKDPRIDVVATYVLQEPGALDLTETLTQAGLTATAPIVAASGGLHADFASTRDSLRSQRIPLFRNPEDAAIGAWALISDRDAAALRRAEAPNESIPPPRAGLPLPRNEAETKDVLRSHGIRTPAFFVCPTREDAITAFNAITSSGDSAVVKVLSREIAHKSAMNGVHLGLKTASKLESALNSIDEIVRGDTGYLVETQAEDGPDLFVAVRLDPTWGAIGLLGLGGTDVEQRGAVQMFALPIQEELLTTRLTNLGLHEDIDVSSLQELYTTMTNALVSWSGSGATSFEINPLRVTDTGLVALDALISHD